MSSVERDGFTINTGAQLMPAAYSATLGLIRDAGLEGQLTKFTPKLGIRRDGVTHRLRGAGPGMAIDGLRTKLISAKSKLLLPRLATDASRMRKAFDYEASEARAELDNENIAEYCERRLNPELRDYLVDPLMRGLVLIDAQAMPVVDFFFTATNLLGSPLFKYPAGFDFICKGVAQRLEDVRFGARVERVERRGTRTEVSWRDAEGEHSVGAAGCVIALPGPYIPEVFPGLGERRTEILTGELDHSVTMGVHFALSSKPDEEAVAITVPSKEMEGLATVGFQHLWMDCTPPGKGLVSGYFDHDWCAPRRDRSDEELHAEMLPMVEEIVPGLGSQIEFSRIDRWDPTTPITVNGVHKLTAELDRLAEPSDPVQLAGDFHSYATVNACVVSGERAASRLDSPIEKAPAAAAA